MASVFSVSWKVGLHAKVWGKWSGLTSEERKEHLELCLGRMGEWLEHCGESSAEQYQWA